MSSLVITVISIVISAIIMGGGFNFLKKKAGLGGGEERKKLEADIQENAKNIEALAAKRSQYIGKGQFEYLLKGIESEGAELIKEKERLKEIEQKLDSAQKNVESKEGHQQEMKSAKEEDEMRLSELREKFGDLSGESIALEQKLAASLKNLDSMLETVQLTESQKAILTELSQALSSAGERMRDLVTEYQALNERLTLLTSQHDDLELEYTKLVEQQLGE